MSDLGKLLPKLVTPPPGPQSSAWVNRLAEVECPAITARRSRRAERGGRDPIVWAEARGANVVDADGNRYVDLSAGFAVASVGHRHPKVVEAARAQLDTLVHAMGDLYPSREKILLGERLAERAPGALQKSIFGLNGGDAVEAALKSAVVATGRSRVLAFEGGYHGMSLGALGVSGYRASFRAPFAGMARQEVRLPYPTTGACPVGRGDACCDQSCLRWVERVLTSDVAGGEDVAALIVEPIQGRGGDIVPPQGWLKELRRITREAGVLLILDEIYTGFGRTGAWFACEDEGVVPDLLVVGKGLGGGAPLSACIGTPEVMEAWGEAQGEAIHTSTFLGHPLSCAMALATLDVIEAEGLVARSRALGDAALAELRGTLAGHPRVAEVRGRGLMIGVALLDEEGAPWAGGGVQAMHGLLSEGFLVAPSGPLGDVLSLSPPLVIDEAQWRAGLDAVQRWVTGLPS